MSQYENVAVPFRQSGNCQYLECQQLLRHSWLREFRDQFDNCFEYDPVLHVHWFYPGGR